MQGIGLPKLREMYSDLTLNSPAGAQLRNAKKRGNEKEGSDFLEMTSAHLVHKTLFLSPGFIITPSIKSYKTISINHSLWSSTGLCTSGKSIQERQVQPKQVYSHSRDLGQVQQELLYSH